jgi:hypothetical protein
MARKKYGTYGRARGSRRFNFMTIVLILLGIALVYAGIRYVPPYWTQWRVKSAISEVASSAYHERREAVLRGKLIDRLAEYGIEIGFEDIEIEWAAEEVVIRVQYHIDVKHPFVEKPHRLEFSPEVKGDLSAVKWD